MKQKGSKKTKKPAEELVLYHGTSSTAIKGIGSRGLEGPFLTDNLHIARTFAHMASGERGGEPIVLAVRVKDPSRLYVDQDMYKAPLSPVLDAYGIEEEDEWRDLIKEGKVERPKDDSDWRTSLRVVKSVVFDGVILPEDILSSERV